jgi:hypothetical protein
MKRMKSKEALQRILNPSFTRIRANQTTQTVSTKWLGYLLMESLCSYRDNPSTFGHNPLSFDSVIKRFVDDNIGSSPRSRRVKNLNRLVTEYERPRGPRQRLALKRVGRRSAAKYLAQKGRSIFKNSVADMRVQRIGRQRVLSDAVFLPEAASVLEKNHRNIQADLHSIVCKLRSEVSDDEVYFLTGAMLFDETGEWRTNNNYTRRGDESGDIDAPPQCNVEFRDYLNPLFSWSIYKPSSPHAPVSAACSITLMEQDQSDRDRVYKGFQAAYQSAQLLSSLVAGTAAGPVGIAFAIASILVSVIQALDGDDLLGTADFRFDNVLSSPAPSDFKLSKEVGGFQKGNGYRYIFEVRYRSQDFDVPNPDYSCRISGRPSLKLRDAGQAVKAKYKMVVSSVGNVQTQVENIRWSVTPHQGTEVVTPTMRDTYIKFRHDGSYLIKVTAKVTGTSVRVTDTHRVGVEPPNGIPR